MKERGKAFDAYSFSNFSSDMPCKKHPFASSVGVCAYCLRDRLLNLVCSECGEQRLSSCSCSDASSSSYRNSCTGEVGGVGRISFLIDNEKRGDESGVILLKRSSSSCVEIKRSRSGFWKIKRLFRKKKEKSASGKCDIWVTDDDFRVVSRSRSLCSFRGGGLLNDADDQGSDYAFSSAKISDVTGGVVFDPTYKHYGFNEIEPRKSGFRGLSDAESEPRKSGFWGSSDAENEPRKSGSRGLVLDGDHQSGVNFKTVKKCGGVELNRVNSVPNWSIYPVKESDFSAMDESAFIDLKLDLSSDHDDDLMRSEVYESGFSLKNVKNSGLFGSCRLSSLNEKELKISGSKGHKPWKWIFRKNFGRKTASKTDGNNTLKS